jgi:hypothetical protein
MFLAAFTLCTGLVCFYYGARALRVRRAIRRLRSRERRGPSHPTDWLDPPSGDPIESGTTLPERGSIERGLVLLTLGACCVVFGVLAA